MKITLVAGDRLTQDHVDAWSHLLRSSRLRKPLRVPAAMAFRLREWAAFR